MEIPGPARHGVQSVDELQLEDVRRVLADAAEALRGTTVDQREVVYFQETAILFDIDIAPDAAAAADAGMLALRTEFDLSWPTGTEGVVHSNPKA